MEIKDKKEIIKILLEKNILNYNDYKNSDLFSQYLEKKLRDNGYEDFVVRNFNRNYK